MMKAIFYEKYGPPEVLHLREVAKPVPAADEVLIKVEATTVTAGDWRMRKADPVLARIFNGLLRPKKINILGFEVAGIVEAIGPQVTQFKPGNAVFAGCGLGFGGYAEYKCLPETAVAHKPDAISFAEAAALPVGGTTALQFLRQAAINPEDKVLIYGASGSVGSYAVQLAKEMGAEVTAVCSTTNVPWVRDLGADYVVDYTKEDFSAKGVIYRVIFDTVGKCPFSAWNKVLDKDGVFLTAYTKLSFPLLKQWMTLTSNKKLIGETARHNIDALNYLSDLVANGKMQVVMDRHYPLTDLVAAHRYVQKGHKKGNVIIQVGEAR
jgi:NADPH:quinone reductase-like Zn-dependent oxidoreductase